MRIKQTFYNSSLAIMQTLLSSILAFVSRTVFIKTLGVEFLGINSLFSDVFMMLSLVELGIGPAVTYFMYTPFAKKEYQIINKLLYFYAKLYKFVAITILILGIVFLPFIDLLIKSNTYIPNVELFYLLMLINLVISYLFSYKRSLFIADQKSYINSVYDLVFNIIKHSIQIILLLLFRRYILYLIVNIVITITANIAISLKANKKYDFIDRKKVSLIQNSEKRVIYSRIMAIFSHKIGSVVVFGTDNLLLSLFTNVTFIGIYSNYVMIINYIIAPLNQIFTAMLGSIGNLSATENSDKAYDVFNKVFFLNFWLYGFATICLYFLLNPFIFLWLGQKYVMDNIFIVMIVINFYISGMRQSAGTFCQARGLFYNTRYKPIIEALINILASLFFASRLGALGIFLGTFTSMVTTSIWVEPYVLYKRWFEKPVYLYFTRYLSVTLVLLLNIIIINFLLNVFFKGVPFYILVLLVVVMSNVFFMIYYRKSDVFLYYYNLAFNLIRRKV